MMKPPEIDPEIMAALFPATYKGGKSSAVVSDDTFYTLEKCPFCGGKGILTKNDCGMYRVHCVHCGVATQNYGSRTAAITRWNTRRTEC